MLQSAQANAVNNHGLDGSRLKVGKWSSPLHSAGMEPTDCMTCLSGAALAGLMLPLLSFQMRLHLRMFFVSFYGARIGPFKQRHHRLLTGPRQSAKERDWAHMLISSSYHTYSWVKCESANSAVHAVQTWSTLAWGLPGRWCGLTAEDALASGASTSPTSRYVRAVSFMSLRRCFMVVATGHDTLSETRSQIPRDVFPGLAMSTPANNVFCLLHSQRSAVYSC